MSRCLTTACLASSLVVSAIAAPAMADTQTFDFNDPKGVNAIVFVMDSEIEPIMGMASGIGGTIEYDKDDPSSFTGTITIDAKKLRTSNPTMASHLHSADWMNVSENPTISFEFSNAEVINADGEEGEAGLNVEGKLTVAGMTIDKQVSVLATVQEDAAAKRGQAESGDLLVLRSTFTVNRKDFGLKPDMGTEKVGPEITILVAIVGYEQVD